MNDTQAQYDIPLINAVRGLPQPRRQVTDVANLPSSSASTLNDYVSSWMVRSYAREWAAIDANTPSDTADTPTKCNQSRLSSDQLPSPERHGEKRSTAQYAVVSIKTRMKRWEIRIWMKSSKCGPTEPLYGFTMRPRLTTVNLHVYVWLLLPTMERTASWRLCRRSQNGVVGPELVWNSEGLVEGGDYVLLRDNGSKAVVVASGPSDFTAFPRRKSGMGPSSRGSSSDASTTPSRAAVKHSEVTKRDPWCRVSGRAFDGMEGVTAGAATVAHVIPFSRPDIGDIIRHTVDPGFWGPQKTDQWKRGNVVNHPTNLIRMAKTYENLFDDFVLTIDPFNNPPIIRICRDVRNAGSIPTEEYMSYRYGDAVFPQPLRPEGEIIDDASSSGNESVTPGPSPEPIASHATPETGRTPLLLHLISSLRFNCTIEVPEKSSLDSSREWGVEAPRVPESPLAEEPIFAWLSDPSFGEDDPDSCPPEPCRQ